MSDLDKEYKYEMSFEKVQKMAFSGITRASRFIKFAQTGCYDLEKINNHRENGEIISHDSSPPIKDTDYLEWKNAFLTWNFNNAVNEIVESFFTFLEFAYVILEMNGKRMRVNSGDNLAHIIKEQQDKIRADLRNKNKLQALAEKGLQFSDDEKKIIESFNEIRNLLSHNLGIADERKKLEVEQGKINLKWYYRDMFIKFDSGEEIKITSEPLKEAGTLCMRPKGLQTKTIDLNLPISFSMVEVQQIAWTFYLLVIDISAKFIKVMNGNSETKDTVEKPPISPTP